MCTYLKLNHCWGEISHFANSIGSVWIYNLRLSTFVQLVSAQEVHCQLICPQAERWLTGWIMLYAKGIHGEISGRVPAIAFTGMQWQFDTVCNIFMVYLPCFNVFSFISDMQVDQPDEKSVITYVASLYNVFPLPSPSKPVQDNVSYQEWFEFKVILNF